MVVEVANHRLAFNNIGRKLCCVFFIYASACERASLTNRPRRSRRRLELQPIPSDPVACCFPLFITRNTNCQPRRSSTKERWTISGASTRSQNAGKTISCHCAQGTRRTKKRINCKLADLFADILRYLTKRKTKLRPRWG